MFTYQANEFIRDVFELGPPILVDSATMKAMKISRFERVCCTNMLPDTSPFFPPIYGVFVNTTLNGSILFSGALGFNSSSLFQHLHNSAAFKARTKARSKFRDKRVDVGEF